MTSFISILYVFICIATVGNVGFLYAATTTTTSVSLGYYVMDIFSDTSCTIAASQQAYQVNSCYLSGSTGNYEVSVLNLVTTTSVFSSFVVYSSTTSTACNAYITSSTSFVPTTGIDLGEGSCVRIGVSSFYYQSWYSAVVPSGLMFNNTINLGSVSNGLIVQEFDSGCTSISSSLSPSGGPRINAFFASTSTCVPFPANGMSTSTYSYITARCTGYGTNGVSLNVYSTLACSGTPIVKQFTAGSTCQSSLLVNAIEPSAALYTCAKFRSSSSKYLRVSVCFYVLFTPFNPTLLSFSLPLLSNFNYFTFTFTFHFLFSYAMAGYASTLLFADSGCMGMVYSATESTLNQCFPSVGTNAGKFMSDYFCLFVHVIFFPGQL